MAVVTYVCDTCKREIELPQVKHGLEVMSNCIITNNCKGKLSVKEIKPSHVRGKLPNFNLSGLEDWVQRKIYFKFEQKIPLKTWNIQHNLGTNPSVQVHIKLADGNLIETNNYQLNYIDSLRMQIVFPESRAGIVQCFVRTPVTHEKIEKIHVKKPIEETYVQIIGNNILTFAFPPNENWNKIKIGFISATTNQIVYHNKLLFSTNTSPLSPWWKQTTDSLTNVYFFGKMWNVLTTKVDDIVFEHFIPDNSLYFFTNAKKYQINEQPDSINFITNVITLNGIIDTSILPQPFLYIDGYKYNISNTLTNQNKTLVKLVEPLSSTITQNSICEVDYPVTNGYVLLPLPPYQQTDKNVNAVIKLHDINYQNAIKGNTHQIKGILFVKQDYEQVVYPPILI